MFAPSELSLPVVDPHMTPRPPRPPYHMPSQSQRQSHRSPFAPAQFEPGYQRSLFTPVQANYGVPSQTQHRDPSFVAPATPAHTHHNSAKYGASPNTTATPRYDGSPPAQFYPQSAGPSFTHHRSVSSAFSSSALNPFATPSSRQFMYASQYPSSRGTLESEHSIAASSDCQLLLYNYYDSDPSVGQHEC
ncbi:hypothetical protein BV22DRAFT_1135339 [Leucogyrophana mollusca]|uniref:Uncharacterized protein n=1 Tax=Leucogyrophana mollusca TaxID=85980 RepID=A0ACB8AW81_9AGAM|nr:hypothetical protein BV22DRAFT_1135339 [Leucogyrophana mollusca]